MSNCKINFDERSAGVAFGIYQELMKNGFKCEDIDIGHTVTNYGGNYCADPNATECSHGIRDGVGTSEEVLEFWLSDKKLSRLLAGQVTEVLPWDINGLDPAIKKTIDDGIAELKRIISASGLKEGTLEFSEKLATGLSWFVAAPRKGNADWTPEKERMLKNGINGDGLYGFYKYLQANGGLRVEGSSSAKCTALDELTTGRGDLTQNSDIMYALLEYAGFSPTFVTEDLFKEKTDNPLVIKDTERIVGKNPTHECVVVKFGNRERVFDPAYLDSNANYQHYNRMSLRQKLSDFYVDRGNNWDGVRAYDLEIQACLKAIEIDPLNPNAFFNMGNAWVKMKDFDKAIAAYEQAIKINPLKVEAYSNLGSAWNVKEDYEKALAFYKKALELDPKRVNVYYHRGNLFVKLGEFEKALADFRKVVELDPSSGYGQKAIEDLQKKAGFRDWD